VPPILLRFLFIAVPLFLPVSTWAASPPVYLETDFSDWQHDDNPSNLCEGYYLPPLLQQNTSNETQVEADGGAFDPVGDSDLEGHIRINKGPAHIDAAKAKLRRDPNTHDLTQILAEGDVRFIDTDTRLDSKTVTYYVKDQKSTLHPAAYRLYKRGARGQAEEANITPHALVLKSVSYTTCAPDKDIWWLTADRMHINRDNGRGYATHVWVFFEGAPIFYSPYFNFPVDKRRQSGFLFPNISSNERSGTEFDAPYYFNLAPNYDAVVTPKWISKRGEALEATSRYLFPHATGTLNAQGLPGDNAYKAFKDSHSATHPGLADNDPQVLALMHGTDSRFAFNFDQRTQSGPWSSFIDYHYVTDDNYLIDLEENIDDAGKTQLLQMGEINYASYRWSSLLRVQSYETLHPFEGPVNTDPYRRLPQLRSQVNTPFDMGLFQARGDTEFVYFYHPKDVVQATRLNAHPIISMPFSRPAYAITPRVQVDFMQYFLEQPGQVYFNRENPNRIVPIFDLDSHMVFERHFQMHNRVFSQTLEPRLYYLYVPYVDQNNLPNFESGLFDFSFQQLFRDNRFTGRDRIGDTNQLTLALTSHLFDTENGRDMLYTGIGNAIYFRDRKVTDCDISLPDCVEQFDPHLIQTRSAIAAFFDYLITDNLSLRTDIEWDPTHRTVDKQSSSASYNYEGRKVINLEYQYVKEDPAQNLLATKGNIQQTRLSAVWPITFKLEGVVRLGYDFPNERFFERLAGLEYDTCCTALRFVVKQYLEPNRDGLDDHFNTGYFLQFALKGLSSVGNDKVDESLKSWVPGYVPQPDNPWAR